MYGVFFAFGYSSNIIKLTSNKKKNPTFTSQSIKIYKQMSQLGERIKLLRENEGLSIEQLSEKSKLSKFQIELLEQSNILPSLSILVRICRALDIGVELLLDGTEEENLTITRKEERPQSVSFSIGSTSNQNSTTYYSLAPSKSNRIMEPFVIELKQEFNNNRKPSSHEGEEFMYVVRGVIKLEYGNHVYILQPGDTVYYDSIVPHKFTTSSESAKIVAVVYTPA